MKICKKHNIEYWQKVCPICNKESKAKTAGKKNSKPLKIKNKICKKHNIEYWQTACPSCSKESKIKVAFNKKNGTIRKIKNFIYDNGILKKHCNKCKLYKKINDIVKGGSTCKKCTSTSASRYYQTNKIKRLNLQKVYYKNNTLNVLEYQNGYRAENCEKVKERKKKYRLNNKEKISLHDKEYYKNNKLYLLEYQKGYRRNNKEKINKRRKNKRNSDPLIKLRHYISVSINKLLKCTGNYKNNISVQEFLPYTIKQLKQHIENQFEPWMNWNNRGTYKSDIWNDQDSSTWTWQLDHIIPHSTFKYTSMDCEEFRQCWALENLRPYSAKQNILDGTNRTRHKDVA